MPPIRTYQYGGETKTHYRLDQSVYLEGLQALQKLLQPIDALVIEPWHRAVLGLVEFGERSGKSGAPRREGKLQSKIKSAMSKRKDLRAWGAVRSRGVNTKSKSSQYPRGYPYPRLLNYSRKHGHTGWFDRGVIEPVMARAGGALDKAADEITKKWET